jgi:predicted SnoaL-like aldol condensation-catalyzing enzyme
MKRIFFSALTGLFLFSCNNNDTHEHKTSEQTEKNLEASRAINKAIETGDVSELDKYIAADAVDHAGMMGDVKGVDSIKTHLASIHTMADDMKVTVIKELADDEYVFQWMKVSGVTKTPDMGVPVGTRFDMNAVQVSKYKDGKATEHWEFMLPKEIMAMTAPGMDNKIDTSMALKGDRTSIKEGLKKDKINKVDEKTLKELNKDPNKN